MSMEHFWNDTERRKRIIRLKTFPTVTLSTTNFTRTGTGTNLDLRRERPATTAWATARPTYQKIQFVPQSKHYVSIKKY